MMTPQEVAKATFAKAAFGYNLAAVDVFLDRLTEDYGNLYQDHEALRAKNKILVEKVEEYRAMEKTLQDTMMAAQKTANSMVAEAEEKRAQILAEAEAEGRERKKKLAAEAADEEKRLETMRAETDRLIAAEREHLATAQRELAAFINGTKALCFKQLELIERLSETDILPKEEDLPLEEAGKLSPEEFSGVKMPEPLELESMVADDKPVDAQAQAAALAEVEAELGGDVNTLMENLRDVIDSFANGDGAAEQKKRPLAEDLGSLFQADEEKDKTLADDRDDDHYDNFAGADLSVTRVMEPGDLQFGRNYNQH